VRTSRPSSEITVEAGRATASSRTGRASLQHRRLHGRCPGDVLRAPGSRPPDERVRAASSTGRSRWNPCSWCTSESTAQPAQPSAPLLVLWKIRCRPGSAEHPGRPLPRRCDGFVLYIPSRHSPEMALPDSTPSRSTLSHPTRSRARTGRAEGAVRGPPRGRAEKYVPGLAAATRRGSSSPRRLPPPRAPETPLVRRHRAGARSAQPKLPYPDPQFVWFAGIQSESSGGVLGVMKGARTAVRAMREQ